MTGKVLVIGGGGREHAIIWKISKSPWVNKIFVASGLIGINKVSKTENVDLNLKDFPSISNWCKNNEINLVIVGPEDPLANGIADVLESTGIKCFGPKKLAAQIESNKDWAKSFMNRYDIPTAKWKSFDDATSAKKFIIDADFPALVVKASGLAAGKGVFVATNKEEACEAVDIILTDKKFGAAGDKVIIEELLEGEEISVLAFCDGNTICAMLPAQDHKRISNGDKGLNTGGMGAYCPCPLITNSELEIVNKEVLERAVDGFKKENIKFIGVLYAGLMLTSSGPKVLEFNCRFGDPETEVILPLLESDLYEIMMACCEGTLNRQCIKWMENVSAVGVVMASRGYPESSSKGQVIFGIDKVEKLPDHIVFHCGTAVSENNEVVTNGGRVLITVVTAPQLAAAAAKATLACTVISFDGEQHRTDIAYKGISRSILKMGTLTYKDSGVDIAAGDALVRYIKPFAKSTDRSGCMGGLGGFGGLFDAKAAGYDDPILVSGTDGVGTKLKIAQICGIHNTIGIDLVAMCVNDVLALGAEPLYFLDYFACGSLKVQVAKHVVTGIANGCIQAGCALIGGETAEMPDMYPEGEYDLAGFAVGAVERKDLLLSGNKSTIEVGDSIIGLSSSGVHSNGFSLVRKVMKLCGVNYMDINPFSNSSETFGEELLKPTKIYVKSVLPLVKNGKLKAFAHITGGGLLENIPRILKQDQGVKLDAKLWKIPPIFGWIATCGGINEYEMLRTFNCGIGAILVVSKSNTKDVLELLQGHEAQLIGNVCNYVKGENQVIVKNFGSAMETVMRPHVSFCIEMNSIPKKKIGVLISGSGTNLQSLINATLDRCAQMGCEIVLVISNKENVEGLRRAERVNIPTKVISHKQYPNRVDFDMAMNKELVVAGVEIICLAGFMRILSGEFTRLWKGRLLNIHPALLPLFKGTHAQKQALEAGVRITGCTVHYVEEDVDAGAIIAQESVPIELNDTEDTLTERIKLTEHKLYPHALRLVATNKVRLGDDNKLIWS